MWAIALLSGSGSAPRSIEGPLLDSRSIMKVKLSNGRNGRQKLEETNSKRSVTVHSGWRSIKRSSADLLIEPESSQSSLLKVFWFSSTASASSVKADLSDNSFRRFNRSNLGSIAIAREDSLYYFGPNSIHGNSHKL